MADNIYRSDGTPLQLPTVNVNRILTEGAPIASINGEMLFAPSGGSGGDAEQMEELPLGEFINSTSKSVVSAYVACVPYIGISYLFTLPSGIRARVSYGSTYKANTGTTEFVENGGYVTIPNNEAILIQKLEFRRTTDTNLSASDVATAVANGTIMVRYKVPDLPIEKRNYENEKYIKAAMFRLGWASNEEAHELGQIPCMPTFVHVSDLHGDMRRFENAVRYANLIKADAVLETGDSVVSVGSDGTTYMKDVLSKYDAVPLLRCIGNHECNPKNTYDNAYLFNNNIAAYITQGNYKATANTLPTLPYYYVDLAEKQIRLIVLNQFDNGCYYGEGLGGRLGQAQVTWFCNTLLSTPQDYGVVIMLHAPEDKVNTPNEMSKWNQTVNYDGRDEDTYGYCVNGLYVNSIRPIKTIVDAFISKTSLSTSYAENSVNGNNGETVTINADFSQVASGVEFICYMTGHRHKDNIGYVNSSANKQLYLNIITSNCHYPKTVGLSFAEGSDIPRGDKGLTQDAFNVYSIDRRNGYVKIARVGASVNFEGIERTFLIAPYRD